MKVALVLALAAGTGVAVAAGLVACGSDTRTAVPTTAPTGTAATSTTVPTATATTTATVPQPPAATQTDSAPNGTDETTTGGATTEGNQPDDTHTSDVPPPKGSPAERFERYCEENPGACD